MAEKNDGGDKTEKPTPKRLRDARKKGDVAKSRELTSTVGLLGWLLVLVLLAGFCARQVVGLALGVFDVAASPDPSVLGDVGIGAARTLVSVVAVLVVPVVLLSLLAEFGQVGPVFATDKLKPKLDKMNPAAGLKKMVSLDNLVEVVKALLKTLLIGTIGVLIVLWMLPDVMRLPTAGPEAGVGALASLVTRLVLIGLGATFAGFVLVAALDAAYQRHSFLKKQRMSIRDIKQEHKEQEGDPHLKSHRKQTAIEQSQMTPAMAARQASVLLTNPTHLAVAIAHDPDAGTVPTVSGKGEAGVAAQMRRAAEAAGVPTLREVPLARALYRAGEEGDPVPEAHFDAIAQVLVWAEGVRQAAQAEGEGEAEEAEAEAEVEAPTDDIAVDAGPARGDA